MSVWIGGSSCDVQTVADGQIDCILGPREGGPASVEVCNCIIDSSLVPNSLVPRLTITLV